MAHRPRPLSPHLQVYRWQVQMVVSILTRITGVVAGFAALLFTAGLVALASGDAAWRDFVELVRSPLGFIVLFGWTWSLAFHSIAGVRHLMQDAGVGMKIESVIRSSWVTIIGSLLVTALVWVLAMAQEGGA